MRSNQHISLFLTAVFLCLGGCNRNKTSYTPPPLTISYTPAVANFITGMSIAAKSPITSGGAATSYDISPSLPAGLSMDGLTGVVSGTPTTATPTTVYTTRAFNVGGHAAGTLTLTVTTPALAQLIPNLDQLITPLAPQESQFQQLITDTKVAITTWPGGPKQPPLTTMQPWAAGQAASTALSPDGKTLLVLTSGWNRVFQPTADGDGNFYNYPQSREYVFIYDISGYTPVKKQVVTIPNSYYGLAFDPSGKAFYVSSGMGDYPYDANGNFNFTDPGSDNVHIFNLNSDGTTWSAGTELALGHLGGGRGLNDLSKRAIGTPVAANSIIYVQPCAAGVALSSDGQMLVVANYYNDSITVFTGGLGNWSTGNEVDLRPGDGTSATMGTPGGEYPFGVVVKGSGSNATAYVSSIRDREIDVVRLSATPLVTARIHVKGQPNKMTLNKAQSRLYVAEDQSDSVDVIGTAKNAILETIQAMAPAALIPVGLSRLRGANTNSVTLSPDEKQLYVTNGNFNSIAVVALSGTDQNDQVIGLIPTGWYPNAVTFSADGKWTYAVNEKSPTGANPNDCYAAGPPTNPPKACFLAQEYNAQLTRAGLQSLPTPTTAQLSNLTATVATNNRFSHTESDSDRATMARVRQVIKHVVFIIKENRSYDQILGDLEIGDGDPSLAEFGEPLTPNIHNLARNFVTLDNFMNSSEVSYDGWFWSTAAKATDVAEHQYPVMYSGRGLSLENEGLNRNVNVSLPTVAARQAADCLTPSDPDLLPGTTVTGAPDGPENAVNTGYLWDSALRAGLTVRNYGFFLDSTLYASPVNGRPTCPGTSIPAFIPLDDKPFESNLKVAYSQSLSLTPYTDPYYRGFDNQYPDYFRYWEWARDFDATYGSGTTDLPALSLVRLMHDHTGNFATATHGVNTPELQQADNDYAVGLLVQKIANSIYANNTLIFVIEDDSQDGGDHVDSHRSIALIAGSYVKQGLVKTRYNTINFVRTIEEVLNLPPLNMNDALASPMADIFSSSPHPWTFTATASASLYASSVTGIPLPVRPAGMIVPKSKHDAEYWARVTKGMDFTSEDRFNFATYNRVLWKGLMGRRPYPAVRNGKDLRHNRQKLLACYRVAVRQTARLDSLANQ